MKTATKVIIGVGVAAGLGGLIYVLTRPSKLSQESSQVGGNIAGGGASGGMTGNQSKESLATTTNFAAMAPYSSAFDRTQAFHGW